MLRLRTLGTASIEGDKGPLAGAATQRRRIALLALLASAGDLGVTRDKLIAYLWPERDDRARHLLNQTIYALRRELGADDLFLGTDPVRLNPQCITSDIGDFSAAIAAGEHEKAAELHKGPFLDGFHLGAGAEEFERWVETTRAETDRRLHDALLALANAASRRGETENALRWWRRVAALDPLDAVAALGLMRAFADSGNRAAALQHAKVYEALVRSELEAAPDSRVVALATQYANTLEPVLPSRTAAAVAPTNKPLSPPAEKEGSRPSIPASAPATRHRGTPFRLHVADALAGSTGSQPVRESVVRRISRKASALLGHRSRMASVAVAIVVLVGAGWTVRAVRARGDVARGAALTGTERVAVLPFAIQSDSAHHYLGRTVTDLLTSSLDGVDRLRTIDARELPAMSRAERDTILDPDRARSIASTARADFFVLGSITELRGRVRVEAALYEARSGVPAIVSRALVEGAADSVFLLSDSLAAQLAAGRGSASDERMARLATTTTSLRALKPYFEGQRALREGNLTLAGEQFRHSVTIDSAFSLGWFRLAGTATWMLDPATARAGAERALRTSAALPEVDRALLSAFSAYVDGRFADAEKRYRAITASWPEESEGWRGLGEVLFHYNWIAGRRATEARTAWERVRRADPSDWRALAHLSEVAAREGRAAEVDSLVTRQLRGDSTDLLRLPAQALRAFALHDAAGQERVIAQLRKATHLWSMLAAWNVAVDLGDLAGAERLTRVLTDSARRPEVRALAHLTLAHLQLARGRRNAAFAEIDSVESFYPPWGPQFRGLLLSVPWAPAAKVELIRARERLARGFADSPAPHVVTPSPWISVHESITPYTGTYVRALLSLRLGESQSARQLADSLAGQAGSPEAAALAIDLARSVRAGDLATRGQRETALALISEHGPNLPFVYPWTSPFYSRGLARYQRASLLASVGRTEEAIRAFDGFADNSLFDLIFVAPGRLERARLLERTGQSAAARQEYEGFIALWRDCDPELRPAIKEAEAALERLRGR